MLYIMRLTYTCAWSCVESCSLLSSYTSCGPGANNLLGLHAVFVKVYPECDGFPVPFVIDFSERGLQSGKLFSCHYTILVYYSYTVMLKCILVSNSFNTQWLFLSFYKPSLVYTSCQSLLVPADDSVQIYFLRLCVDRVHGCSNWNS